MSFRSGFRMFETPSARFGNPTHANTTGCSSSERYHRIRNKSVSSAPVPGPVMSSTAGARGPPEVRREGPWKTHALEHHAHLGFRGPSAPLSPIAARISKALRAHRKVGRPNPMRPARPRLRATGSARSPHTALWRGVALAPPRPERRLPRGEDTQGLSDRIIRETRDHHGGQPHREHLPPAEAEGILNRVGLRRR